jgi:histidinol-phosphate aminotransferase
MAKELTKKGIRELVPYPPGKPIEELERELGITGSIKLASNENPLGPSPKAVQAVLEHVNGLNRYPDGSGYYLKSKLSAKFGLPLDQLIIGNGSNEIIELIIRTFLSVDDEVIQAFPTFLVYDKMVKGAGGKMTSIPLSNLKIDLDVVMGAITPRTKIIFINNPNNPTGSILSKKDLMHFFDNIPEDILVVLDEAYIEFVKDPDVALGIEFLSSFPLTVVLRTFSKLYGLAGLRIGYGFSSREVIDYMNRVRQPFNVNSLAQAAATAALDDEKFVSRTLRLVKEGLSYLYKQLQDMDLETVPTETNFFLIKMPVAARKVYELMLREGVIIRSMDSYDLEQYIRVNVGLPEENERFITALKKVLKNLG